MREGGRTSGSRDGHNRRHGDGTVVTSLHLERVLWACLKVERLQESDDPADLAHREC